MKVEWTDRGGAELDEVRASRALLSEESADRLVAAIFSRTRQLADFPLTGRVIPEFQMELLRELIEQDYRILYEIYPDRVAVWGVISGYRRLVPEEVADQLGNLGGQQTPTSE